MIWIVFVIWFVFALACGIMEKKTDKGFYGFLFLLSLPIMFYLPLLFWLFQNKNLTFVTKYDIINIENKKGEKNNGS